MNKPTELVRQTLDRLQERFPCAFATEAPKPHGFDADSVARLCLDIPPDLVRKAINVYRSQSAYGAAMCAGAEPVDLHGKGLDGNDQPAEAFAAAG
jgi:sRNA-binding protein